VKGEIVNRVVGFLSREIAEDGEAVKVTVLEQGPDEVIVEVRTAKRDMGRVIGRRGRVAKAIRTLAQAAGEEEGLDVRVEFID
jgi:predicted RNA-binding protein YlqC (UPF0109 family)